MTSDELEELLGEVLSTPFTIEKTAKGEIIILTGLKEDDHGELVDMDDSDPDDDLPEEDHESLDLDDVDD
jgi:hypothetical protein